MQNVFERSEKYYSKLFRRFVILTLICSCVPLILVGWGIHFHYTRFTKERVIQNFKNQVDAHRTTIELFLQDRKSTLQAIAKTHSKASMAQPSFLRQVFGILNMEYGESFTDLGVIDDQGNHLAYIGPYDLLNKNYSKTHWFQEVSKKGLYISDVFMGYRKSPHFVIAVTQGDQKKTWILRATIDSESFRDLVEQCKIGQSGDVYLVNDKGLLQTTPRFQGHIMGQDPYEIPIREHQGIRISTLQASNKTNHEHTSKQLVATTWLDKPPWMLVVRQDYSEAFSEVSQTNQTTLIFLFLSTLCISLVIILITKHMISVIKTRDQQSEQLNKQLLQTGKLAAVGELSAGVAHELNNPLAIILTEKQLLLDTYACQSPSSDELKESIHNAMNQIGIQVQRCKRLTQNLLRFARRTQSIIEPVDLNVFLNELIELMEREARSSGIKFFADLEEHLPIIHSDPSQLQQVFLNLITNAIDAHSGMSYGSIHLKTSSSEDTQHILIEVSDTGCGMAPEILEKIFDPFFTTKPVGKGTGLGLSICYGIIERLGGTIEVTSEPGKGTSFFIRLPLSPPSNGLES
jgi:two-component system NtrC family sensor kinase